MAIIILISYTKFWTDWRKTFACRQYYFTLYYQLITDDDKVHTEICFTYYLLFSDNDLGTRHILVEMKIKCRIRKRKTFEEDIFIWALLYKTDFRIKDDIFQWDCSSACKMCVYIQQLKIKGPKFEYYWPLSELRYFMCFIMDIYLGWPEMPSLQGPVSHKYYADTQVYPYLCTNRRSQSKSGAVWLVELSHNTFAWCWN